MPASGHSFLGKDSYCRQDVGANTKIRRNRPPPEWQPLRDEIPPENYLGVVLGDKYQITFQWPKKDHVGVYSVTSFCTGESFTARAFELCPLPDKLHMSSKKRVRRLRRSDKFEDEFRLGRSRFLISRLPAQENEKTPHRLCNGSGNGATANARDVSREWPHLQLGPSPDVSLSPYSNGSKPYPTRSGTYAEAVVSWTPASQMPSCRDDRPDTIDGFSISRKGYRQRARRQRRREERRRKAAYVNGEHVAPTGPATS
jgi:hypothetical protein